MAEADQDRYPVGVPCWVDTGRVDPEGAVAFYGGVFGWEFEDRSPADAPQRYLVARLRGLDVAAVGEQPGTPGPPMWNTYVRVASADETAAKVTAAGGRVHMEPFDVGTAGRMAAFTDREGAAFCVWEAKEFPGAALVNEPGTWVSSELNTRDPEAALAFYGSVFGWEASDPEVKDLPTLLLAGYGDHLARRDPELRTRLKEWKAPERFEDTVAWIAPMSSEQSDNGVPPHWGITFSVDDADATAKRADELGGRVLVGPFDTPWVRMAVLSDPEGAAFSIGKFTPPS